MKITGEAVLKVISMKRFTIPSYQQVMNIVIMTLSWWKIAQIFDAYKLIFQIISNSLSGKQIKFLLNREHSIY